VSRRGGIVRPSKRPPGWLPPGPEPAGPGDREDLWPAEGEDLCHLTGSWRIFQRTGGHRYSLDDTSTAWYALRAAKGRDINRHLDLGCGIGSVLLMVVWGLDPETVSVGIEAQELSHGLAERSIAYNGVDHRVRALNGDIREASMLPDDARFDLVTGSPPYIPIGDGVMSDKEQCAPARFELRGGIEDYCLAAARWMAPDGLFVFCHAAPQRQRCLDAARAAGMTVVRFQEVVPRAGRNPLLTLFVARFTGDGDPEPLEDAPLVVRDVDGARTPDYLSLRNDMGMPP
jgi:tRNA1Val (adenine37-N6)-methyltransferase